MSSKDSPPFSGHLTVLDDSEFHVRGRTLFFAVVLFCIVLLVTVLLLYARWVCRCHLPGPTQAPHAPPTRPPVGLDPVVIRALPIVLYQQQSSRDLEACDGVGVSECCICLGVFEDGEKVKVLPKCCHCYHSECVDTWLADQASCPLCRTQLRPRSDVPQIVVQ